MIRNPRPPQIPETEIASVEAAMRALVAATEADAADAADRALVYRAIAQHIDFDAWKKPPGSGADTAACIGLGLTLAIHLVTCSLFLLVCFAEGEPQVDFVLVPVLVSCAAQGLLLGALHVLLRPRPTGDPWLGSTSSDRSAPGSS